MRLSLRLRVFLYASTIFIITIVLIALMFNIVFLFGITDAGTNIYIEQPNLSRFIYVVNILLLVIMIIGEVIIFLASTSVASNIIKTINAIEEKSKSIISSSGRDDIIYEGAIREFYELTKSINSVANQVKKRDEVRAKIISDYAHEFRTPLTILLSTLEAIYDGVFKPTKEIISSCKIEVVRLNDMSEYLYKIADVESYKVILDRKDINLSKVIKHIIPLFKEYAKLRNISIVCNLGNHRCNADMMRFQSIVINLISNAINHSSDNSEVNITLTRVDDDTLKLIVSDKGVGISKYDILHIFSFGYRSERVNGRRIAGRGIGLSIVKSFVLAHGWSIDVDSEIDVGTTFTVTMLEKRS